MAGQRAVLFFCSVILGSQVILKDKESMVMMTNVILNNLTIVLVL